MGQMLHRVEMLDLQKKSKEWEKEQNVYIVEESAVQNMGYIYIGLFFI